MTNGEISLGEIDRRLIRIERKLDEKVYVSNDVYIADERTRNNAVVALDARLKAIESTQRWLTRTLGGTVILMLSNVVYQMIQSSGGPGG